MDLSIEYVNYVRTKNCCVCGQSAEPHHLKAVGMGRNRKKPMAEHYTVVPLCRSHHSEIHSEGVKTFSKLYGCNIWKVAALLIAEFFWNRVKN